MSDKPKRAYTLTLTIGADTLNDLLDALRDVNYSILTGSRHVVTGGYSWGGYWDVEEAPEMTHERYMAALDEYLALQKTQEVVNGNA